MLSEVEVEVIGRMATLVDAFDSRGGGSGEAAVIVVMGGEQGADLEANATLDDEV